MAGLNKWIGMGRLTSDPEIKQTPNGKPVATFKVAIDGYTNTQTGERHTDFIDCVAWGKTAEFLKRFFGKGNMICVVGAIQTRSWQAQDGSKRYATEIKVDEVLFTGEKKDTQQTQDNGAFNDGQFEELTVDDDLPF